MDQGKALALYILKSIISCSIINLFRDFLRFYSIFTHFLSSIFQYITRDDSLVDIKEYNYSSTSPSSERDQLSVEDAKVVIERLGILDWRESECWREELDEFLEEKEVSLEEVKEAFYVFDRNEDGFVTPDEVWSVMRRLGMREGLRMDDCVRMIRVFDDDGDGRISFYEFKRLLENAM